MLHFLVSSGKIYGKALRVRRPGSLDFLVSTAANCAPWTSLDSGAPMPLYKRLSSGAKTDGALDSMPASGPKTFVFIVLYPIL